MDDVPEAVREFAEKLPRFGDGRIDYHDSKEAPVITVFVKYGEKLLLMKRSDRVHTYRGKWNTVAGYLDELKPVREKVMDELREEIGVREDRILSMVIKGSYRFTDGDRTWIVHPAIVELKNPEIKLDWEHTEYRWVSPGEIRDYDTVPNLEKGLKMVLTG